MYTKTQQKAERVFTLYNQGMTVTEIIEAEKPEPVSKKTVKKILASFGIDYTTELAKKEAAKPAQVIAMYAEGKSLLEIEATLKLTYTTVRDILAKNGIEQRSLSEQHVIRHGYTLDNTVFDELNEHSLYWLGFLHADGHIRSERENGVMLGLAESDYGHMVKYQQFLKTDMPIKVKPNGKNNIAVLQFGSEKIHRLLRSYGYTGNKSYDADPHELLISSRDFWRGVIDGDGCLWAAEEWTAEHGYRRMLHLCGTEATCRKFMEFIAENDIVSKATVRKIPNESTWIIQYEATIADSVAKLLYKDATIYLDRKYQKYLDYFRINEFGTVIHSI